MSFNRVKDTTAAANVTLVAVSKTKPVSAISDLYRKGQRHFGENRVQEMVEKYRELPKDVYWHQIGRLQTNKVKYIAPFVHLIHSVDSEKLALSIIKEGKNLDRCIDILIQVKVALEDTKQGINISNVYDTVQKIASLNSPYIRIRGLMAMASFVSDMEIISQEFTSAKIIFHKIKKSNNKGLEAFDTLSMGMSSDYKLAIECGSNMVRVGSLVFGKRK
ncbi:MAG: YggS family pyridoxal phosphate-dependent enzyme [Saprospiraceae bacterium]